MNWPIRDLLQVSLSVVTYAVIMRILLLFSLLPLAACNTSIYTKDGVTDGDTFYLAPLYMHIEGGSFSDYRASASKLAALSPEVDELLTSHNVPLASGDYLSVLHAAMESIAAGSDNFEPTDGAREYPFDGFSVITRDPPQRAER